MKVRPRLGLCPLRQWPRPTARHAAKCFAAAPGAVSLVLLPPRRLARRAISRRPARCAYCCRPCAFCGCPRRAGVPHPQLGQHPRGEQRDERDELYHVDRVPRGEDCCCHSGCRARQCEHMMQPSLPHSRQPVLAGLGRACHRHRCHSPTAGPPWLHLPNLHTLLAAPPRAASTSTWCRLSRITLGQPSTCSASSCAGASPAAHPPRRCAWRAAMRVARLLGRQLHGAPPAELDNRGVHSARAGRCASVQAAELPPCLAS